jgi:hypothetical protein
MEEYFSHKARTKKFGVIVGWVLLGIVAVTGFAFLFGYVVMLLWNWLMPMLFGITTVSFWQAVGIIILAKLLFGGFGGHGHKSDKKHKKSSKSKSFKNGFSKWKYYDKFWKEEGEKAYDAYIEMQVKSPEDEIIEDENENSADKDIC